MTKAVKRLIFCLAVVVCASQAQAEVTQFEKLNRRYGAVGSYRALVIGIDRYGDGAISGSGAAVAGARAVAKALSSKAGF